MLGTRVFFDGKLKADCWLGNITEFSCELVFSAKFLRQAEKVSNTLFGKFWDSGLYHLCICHLNSKNEIDAVLEAFKAFISENKSSQSQYRRVSFVVTEQETYEYFQNQFFRIFP